MLTHRAGKNIHQHVQSKHPRRAHGKKTADPDVLIRFQSNALAVRRQTGWTTTDDTYTPGWDYRRLEEALTFSIDWATSYMNMKSAALQVWRQGTQDTSQDTFTSGFGYRTLEG